MTASQKSETPLAGGVIAKTHENGAIVAGQPDDRKAVATLVAKFALLGHQVHELANGGFLVTRWNLTRHCMDAASLARFLVVVGGVQ